MLPGPSPSVVAYHSDSILLGSDSDQEHVWREAIIEVFVFTVVSFIAAARDGIFMSKTVD